MILAKLPSHNRNSLLHQITNTLYNQPPSPIPNKIKILIQVYQLHTFSFVISTLVSHYKMQKNQHPGPLRHEPYKCHTPLHEKSRHVRLPTYIAHSLKALFSKTQESLSMLQKQGTCKGMNFFFFYKKICNEFHIQHVQCKSNLKF